MEPVCSTLTVLDNVPFGQTGPKPQFYALRLSPPDWESWCPGQFVMLKPHCFGLGKPLGRPFSICHFTRTQLVCFFKVAGDGTRIMANLRAGDKILSWGPLGTWFAVEEDTPTLILAGGMGIAPFVGYVLSHPKPQNVAMLFGHREDLGCYPLDSISSHISVTAMQDAGARDLEAFVNAMEDLVGAYAAKNGLVVACGPGPFLKAVNRAAVKHGARLQISLENRMACGLGACLGCVCKTSAEWPEAGKKNWPVQTCLKGPVFWSRFIDFEEI